MFAGSVLRSRSGHQPQIMDNEDEECNSLESDDLDDSVEDPMYSPSDNEAMGNDDYRNIAIELGELKIISNIYFNIQSQHI